jgi:hypothetical protein
MKKRAKAVLERRKESEKKESMESQKNKYMVSFGVKSGDVPFHAVSIEADSYQTYEEGGTPLLRFFKAEYDYEDVEVACFKEWSFVKKMSPDEIISSLKV